MDLNIQKNTVRLVRQIMDTGRKVSTCIPYAPQKTAFNPNLTGLEPLGHVSPESEGLDSGAVADFVREVFSEKRAQIQSLIVMRGGKIVSETARYPYRTDVWHVTHSLCKSITGIAVGMLVDEGKLSVEDKVADIFPDKTNAISQLKFRSLSVKHLLTMSSGVVFNEAGSVTETDWAKAYFESSLRFEPGTAFAYNSMNTYMLSAAVKRISGQGLTEFLTPRLFAPLGIENIFWEKCPLGVEKGGWGLYIMPEDVAKIGQLLLDRGMHDGKRIISEKWVDMSMRRQIEVPRDTGRYDYGYQIWTGENPRLFLFNGMFGQNMIAYPDTGIIISVTAGNGDLFQGNPFFDIVEKYFGADFTPSDALAENSVSLEGLRALEDALRQGRRLPEKNALTATVQPPALPIQKKNPIAAFFAKLLKKDGGNADTTAPAPVKIPLPEQCARLSGLEYAVLPSERSAIGLLPRILAAMQNNFPDGISGFGFKTVQNEGEELFCVLVYGINGQVTELPVGFERAVYKDLGFSGEIYTAAVRGAFATDEDGRLVLKVYLDFIETANRRTLKFYFGDADGDDGVSLPEGEKGGGLDRMLFRTEEYPGRSFVVASLSSLLDAVKGSRLVETVTSFADYSFITYKIGEAIEPELQCVRKQNK